MILILGGTGFLARHLCIRLHEHAIRAATMSFNPSLSFLREWAPSVRGIELGSADARAAFAESDVVIHLAHRSRPSSNRDAPHVEIESSVTESVRLFQQIFEANPHCHLVYASSGGQIYGPGHTTPIPETAPSAPTTPYSLGKQMTEDAIAYFARVTGATTTILRIANPVGRWQLDRAHGLVAAAIRAIRSGESLTIFGDGLNVRDYFDVDDLADLLAGFAEPARRVPGIFNIGSGLEMTERAVIDLVQRTVGRQVQFKYAQARPFDLRYAVLDVSKARRLLGWTPSTPLEKTVRKLDDSLQ
jgi:UDP-glucose 4-epimerase